MTQPSPFGQRRAVAASAEFYRISALPRRTWTFAEGEILSEQLSPIFRRPGSSVRMLPQQAIAVREVLQNRGGFLPMGVGAGKTLTFLLLGRALEMRFPGIAARTFHLVKAGLDNAGRKAEITAYLRDWAVPAPNVIHFDAISPVSGKNLLETLDPLALLIDEIHHFKSRSGAWRWELVLHCHALKAIIMNYSEFIAQKAIIDLATGFEPPDLNPMLFDFQRDITKWALRRGRAAIFEDCGLGKSFQQIEWSQRIVEHTNKFLGVMTRAAPIWRRQKPNNPPSIFKSNE